MKICDKDIKVQGRLLRVAHVEGDKYKFLEDPETLLNGLRKSEARIDLFTFMQKLPDSAPKFAYPMEMDNFAALPISTFDHWWMKTLGFKARNKAKQAEKKGVVLREVAFDDDLVRGICEIYNETPIRQGRRFPHYGMRFEKAREYAGTFLESSIFIGAFFEERLIGFVKLTIDDTRTQAGLMHIVSMIQHRDKAPTNALVAHAVRACANQNIPYLVYSNFAYGKKERDSLSEFKERNGFQRMNVPRYYVPLTLLGQAALDLGLHHKITDHIPESVASKIRQFRKTWYERRFPTVSEAS